MRSTKAGIPRSVSATRCSSSNAGTTTATRLPSTISVLLRDAPRGPSLEERIGDRGGERSEQQADQPADQGGVATTRRGRLVLDHRLLLRDRGGDSLVDVGQLGLARGDLFVEELDFLIDVGRDDV